MIVAPTMRAVFEGAPDAMLITDDAGRCVDANPAACELIGLPREAILGQLQLSIPLGDPARAGEYAFVRPTGEVRAIELRAHPNVLPGCHLSILSDVTDRKLLRDTEAQLRQLQKMEAIGSLAGGIAHDFNNILSVILTATSFLEQAIPPDGPSAEDVAEIKNAAERAARLTRQLLAFSRRQVLEPRVVDLDKILANMERMLKRMLGETIVLDVAPDPDVGNVLVDPTQLEQVLLNLAVNARDAMPTGGALRIETSNVVDDGVPYVRIAVTDTGVGMDAATRERIFEPFFTTKAEGYGTGMGLATVFAIVQQSGGRVRVDSELGRGTIVSVLLPRTCEPPVVAPHVAAPAGQTHDETVLLVEDEEAVRRVLDALLRRLGYRVLAAANAGEALLICEQHPSTIHLLLTDLVLPVMNGRQLAARLTRIRPSLPVVYMSGSAIEGVGDAFIQKPIQRDQLARIVREVLDRASSSRSLT